LAPLANDWDKLDAQRKQKWLGIAKRYPNMGPPEQERIQRQMSAWAQLTPEQRRAAREQYKSLKQLPPDKRQGVREKWQEYQQLPPEKRRELSSHPPPGKPGSGANVVPGPPAPKANP